MTQGNFLRNVLDLWGAWGPFLTSVSANSVDLFPVVGRDNEKVNEMKCLVSGGVGLIGCNESQEEEKRPGSFSVLVLSR